MNLDRRDFIRQTAIAVAASAAGLPAEGQSNVITDSAAAGTKWHKAPCRFCGTGCGVTVAVKDNRIVATHGDPQAEVNRGLNCVKGYFLSKVLYGEDRLTRPLLRMKDGRFDKNGEFAPVSWDKAFEVNASTDAAVRASCVEFVLAGLYATDRVSRSQKHGRIRYEFP